MPDRLACIARRSGPSALRCLARLAGGTLATRWRGTLHSLYELATRGDDQNPSAKLGEARRHRRNRQGEAGEIRSVYPGFARVDQGRDHFPGTVFRRWRVSCVGKGLDTRAARPGGWRLASWLTHVTDAPSDDFRRLARFPRLAVNRDRQTAQTGAVHSRQPHRRFRPGYRGGSCRGPVHPEQGSSAGASACASRGCRSCCEYVTRSVTSRMPRTITRLARATLSGAMLGGWRKQQAAR